MSRIKAIVEQGKQELGINNSSTLGTSEKAGVTGKPVHSYTKTKTISISQETLLGNRVVAQDPTDPKSKTFQILRTKILQQMRKRNWNTLAITAPTEGAGKSLVAANLAISIAMEGNQSVLLVDMDLSKPSINRYFGFKPEYGIHDYFEGSVALEDTLVHPEIERLVILPGKRGIVNSSEQISSPMVKNLVNELKTRYDSRLVIFDLPPTLVSDEVMIFLPYVDCSLLVVEAGKNTPKEVEDSLDTVGNNPLLGTVLNKSEQAKDLPFYI